VDAAHTVKRGRAFCVLMEKREDKGPLGSLEFRRQDNIKVYVKK
jgi:hypothetical protein